MQPGKEPVDRLGEEREPAIVNDQIKPRSNLSQTLLSLRTDIQRGLFSLGSPRSDVSHRNNGADGVFIACNLTGIELTLKTFLRNPGGHEVLLNNGHPAVIRLGRIVLLVIRDVREGNLLELILGRIKGGTQIAAGEGIGTRGRLAVAHQLVVDGRIDGLIRTVHHFLGDLHAVVVSREGIGLQNLNAAAFSLKAHAERLVARIHHERTVLQLENRLVCGSVSNADHTALGFIEAILGVIKQHNVVVLSFLVAENEANETDFIPLGKLLHLQKLSTNNASALFVKRELHQIRLNIDRLHALGTVRGRIDSIRGSLSRGRNRSGGSRSGRSRSALLLRRTEERRTAVVNLPAIPQHE